MHRDVHDDPIFTETLLRPVIGHLWSFRCLLLGLLSSPLILLAVVVGSHHLNLFHRIIGYNVEMQQMGSTGMHGSVAKPQEQGSDFPEFG